MSEGSGTSSGDHDSRPIPRVGRIAGIDFGTVRIGVSICDPDQTISSPFENYNRRGESFDAQYFSKLVEAESIVAFIVGLPLHLSGDESEKSIEARAFGNWLAQLTGLPVAYHDERFTSSAAEDALLAANLTKKRRKARMDMLAAQMILQAYMDARKSSD